MHTVITRAARSYPFTFKIKTILTPKHSIHCLELIMQMTRDNKKAPFTYRLTLSIDIKYSCVPHMNWHSATSQLSICAFVSRFSLFMSTEEKRLPFHNMHSRYKKGCLLHVISFLLLKSSQKSVLNS